MLLSSVGNNLTNREDDVLQVKNHLSKAGIFDNRTAPEPHGFITREMDEGIKAFQKSHDLKIDGKLFPGGETENALFVLGRAENINKSADYDATGRMKREPLFQLSKKENSPPIPKRKPKPPEKDDNPPIPERKPKPPVPEAEEESTQKDKPDCSDLEVATSNAQALLARSEEELGKIEQGMRVKEQTLEKIERQISEEQALLDKIRYKVESVGTGAGAITGGFVGGVIGRNPKTVIDGAKGGAAMGHEIAVKAMEIQENEIRSLRKKRDALLSEVQPLRKRYDSVVIRVNENRRLLKDARAALQKCKNR